MLRTEAFNLSLWVLVAIDKEARLFVEQFHNLISEFLVELHFLLALMAGELVTLRLHAGNYALNALGISAR